MRGYITRKATKKAKELLDAKPQMSNRSNKVKAGAGSLNWGYNFANKNKPNFGANSYAKELQEMPDYSNAQTRETEERLGPFVFDKPESPR